MDLRLRLLAYLSAFSLLLLCFTALAMLNTLHRDVAEEVEASTRLAELMLTIGEARQTGSEPLRRLLEKDRLRHVTLFLDRSETEQPSPSAPGGPLAGLVDRLAQPLSGSVHERRIRFGDETLVIRADPRSEIHEILRDAARMLGTLLLFSLGTMLLAWYAAHRALRPVRAFEDGLERLTRGETDATLPRFELREFRRIADAIDRLAAHLGESRAAERRLTRRLLELQESERRELARELHDEFGQSLTAIGVGAAFVERHAGTADSAALIECARDIRCEASRVSGHVRNLLRELRPHGIESLGVVDSLRELIEGWRQRAPQIELDVTLPTTLPALSPIAGLALYRTLQEALTNVLRHSGASRARIVLASSADMLRLTVADNGRGRAASVAQGSGGGLPGMLERALMADGQLRFSDAPGGGLQLELSLPTENQRKGKIENDPHPAA